MLCKVKQLEGSWLIQDGITTGRADQGRYGAHQEAKFGTGEWDVGLAVVQFRIGTDQAVHGRESQRRVRASRFQREG